MRERPYNYISCGFENINKILTYEILRLENKFIDEFYFYANFTYVGVLKFICTFIWIYGKSHES